VLVDVCPCLRAEEAGRREVDGSLIAPDLVKGGIPEPLRLMAWRSGALLRDEETVGVKVFL
jgi:hypothetical protein